MYKTSKCNTYALFCCWRGVAGGVVAGEGHGLRVPHSTAAGCAHPLRPPHHKHDAAQPPLTGRAHPLRHTPHHKHDACSAISSQFVRKPSRSEWRIARVKLRRGTGRCGVRVRRCDDVLQQTPSLFLQPRRLLNSRYFATLSSVPARTKVQQASMVPQRLCRRPSRVVRIKLSPSPLRSSRRRRRHRLTQSRRCPRPRAFCLRRLLHAMQESLSVALPLSRWRR